MDELLYTQEDIDEWIRTCEELQERNRELKQELEEINQKIEQGTLIELPCKVGDTVYVILNCDKGEKSIEDGIVTEIECAVGDYGSSHCRIYVDHGYIFSGNTKFGKQRYIFFENEVFLTREEAEKRLRELQGDIE